MAGEVTFTLDASAVLAAMAAFPDACQRACTAAAQVSAAHIVTEAQRRLARQLGPASTGQTVGNIRAIPLVNGGYLVVSDRHPYPNLPLWLEKGTKAAPRHHATAAKPYFYVSAELEVPAHLQRITQAIESVIAESGLGA